MSRNFGVALGADTKALTGLEMLQGMVAGDVPSPHMAKTANIHITEAEEGRVVFEGAPEERHQNPAGTTHGGWYAMILDSALGCVVMSCLPVGVTYTTSEYKVNLIRAIPTGRQMRAIATADHVGRSTGVATAELYGIDDGKLYGKATTTCLIMKKPD